MEKLLLRLFMVKNTGNEDYYAEAAILDENDEKVNVTLSQSKIDAIKAIILAEEEEA